jgi:tetratricopeptide (TPR) repeat protein
MKTVSILHGLLGAGVIWLTAGCGTLVYLRPKTVTEPAPTQASEKLKANANALAQYSMGVMEELAGQDEEAIARYRASVALDPDNPALKMELAVGLLHRQQYDEMDQLIDQVLARDPAMVRALQLRALGYRLRGLHKEALDPLALAMAQEPHEAIHYLEVASIHARLGNLPAAMSTLEHALPRVTDRLSIFQALGEMYLRQAGEIARQKSPVPLPKTPLDVMRAATDEFNQDIPLLSLYGDLLILHQDIEAAIEVFARIEELNPTDLQLRQKLAISLAAVGNRQKAIELLLEVARQRPTQHRLWYYLAELNEQEGNIPGAIDSYRKAIEARPALPEGYLKLAFIYLQQGETDEALRVLDAGSKTNPDDLRIIEMHAYISLNRGDFDAAIKGFQDAESRMAASNKTPLLTNFHLNYAVALQLAGRREEAMERLRIAATNQPGAVDDFMALSFRNRENRARLVESLDMLDTMTDLIPEESSTYTLYGLMALNAERHAAALEHLERAEALARESGEQDTLNAQFYFWLGASAERIKQFDKSEKYFGMAIEIEPDHADSHNYLAYMLAERGEKLDLAFDHIGVALAIEPDNAAYLDTRGWIYYQLGKYAEALADIQTASDKMPDDPTVSDHLGDVHFAMGNRDQAVVWWQKALATEPDNEKIKGKLIAAGVDGDEPAPRISTETTGPTNAPESGSNAALEPINGEQPDMPDGENADGP